MSKILDELFLNYTSEKGRHLNYIIKSKYYIYNYLEFNTESDFERIIIKTADKILVDCLYNEYILTEKIPFMSFNIEYNRGQLVLPTDENLLNILKSRFGFNKNSDDNRIIECIHTIINDLNEY